MSITTTRTSPTSPTPTTRTPEFHTLLVFRAPTTLSEALAALARQRGTSVSAVIRELLLAGLRAA
jgi:hypothetical protein